MAKKKFILDTTYVPNGSPCSHNECGKKKTECPHCGRVECRGNVQFELRTGFVMLERLNSTYKKEHNKLSPQEQELNTIKIRFAPDNF